MRPYIYARKNLIHIIDVRETVRGLLRAKKYLAQISSRGSLVLFVGTKRQAGRHRRSAKPMRCGMPYVNDRWLGGSLTNFRTIRSRLTRLEELETIRAGEQINTYSKKMQSALTREYRKMFRNLNGMRTMNRLPECLIVDRSEEGKERDQRSPQAGRRHDRVDRYRLRSGPGGFADPRQRRQHAIDRAGDQDAVRRNHCRQGPGCRPESNGRRRRRQVIIKALSRQLLRCRPSGLFLADSR